MEGDILKMVAHGFFAAGVSALVASKLLGLAPVDVLVYAVIAYMMQYVIDYGSHEVAVYRGTAYVRRTSRFHSPSGAAVVGLAFAVLLFMLSGCRGIPCFLGCLLAMEAASFSHLLLDLPTERGIYVRGRRTSRKRGISSRNPIANTLAVAAGLYMLAVALGLD